MDFGEHQEANMYKFRNKKRHQVCKERQYESDKSSKKKSKARHTNAHIQGKPTDVNFCYVSLHKHPSQLGGMLSHILGWFLFVICFFKKNAFSFCPTIQTKRPNFNFPHFFVFLCARCKTLMNLLLVVPKTRVVVNVRLCAFVDHRRLTRNLKNWSWARKLWLLLLCFRPLKALGRIFSHFRAWYWLPRTLKGQDIAFLCLVELRVLQNPQPPNSISGSSRGAIFVWTNMACCWRIYRLAAGAITNWSTLFVLAG